MLLMLDEKSESTVNGGTQYRRETVRTEQFALFISVQVTNVILKGLELGEIKRYDG